MRRSLPSRDQLLMRIGAAKTAAGRAFSFVKIQVPTLSSLSRASPFVLRWTRTNCKRPNYAMATTCCAPISLAQTPLCLDPLRATDADRICVSIAEERAGNSPIYHHLEHRVDAHILVAFLAYCLQVTLKNRLWLLAPGLTQRR